MKPNECTRLVTEHAALVTKHPAADSPPWKVRHVAAWNYPKKHTEVAVKLALQAYAAMADGYNDDFEDSGGLGRDGYFGEHALAMLQAVHAWLNMGGTTRLDSGAISRLIGNLARASGVNPDDV